MNPNDIRKHIHTIVDGGNTPGDAFDAILALRADHVAYKDIVEALSLDRPSTNTPPLVEQDLSTLDTGGDYNDDTRMKFGKYKEERLGDVPPGYFNWLWEKRPLSDPKLEVYIKKNIPAFKIEDPDLIWK